MSRWWRCARTAVWHAVLEQSRNRSALVLAVFFVPLWLCLAHLVLPADPVLFLLRAADRPVRLDANAVAELSGALHSLTLVVGFMMFLSTSRSAVFYRRLATAGCPRSCLVPAQGSVLLMWAAPTAAYATAWVCFFRQPERVDVLAAALCVGALVYGAAGILLATLTRSELAGLFTVTVVGFVDLTLQNPVANSCADSPVVRLLPAYGAMQSAVSAVSTGGTPWEHLLLGLWWAAVLSLAALVVFTARTGGRKAAPAARRPVPGGSARERSSGPGPADRSPGGPARAYRLAGITDPEVRAGYEACRRLVRRSRRLDSAIVQLFPPGLRPLLWAMYGYGRTLDGVADAPDDTPRRRAERVGAHSRALETDLRHGRSDDPVRAALVDAVWRWDLPADDLSVMAAGHRLDAARETRLLTWEDWHAYWDGLSFPFGVSRLPALLSGPGMAFTAEDADALHRWSDAHNLVDALRDLREDARQGFVQLPHAVLEEYAVTADDLRQPRSSERVTALVNALADRADAWLDQAACLGGQHPPAAAAWRTVVALQRLELNRMRRRPGRLRHRVRPGTAAPGRDRHPFTTADRIRFHCLLLAGRLRVARAWRRARTAAATPPAVLPVPVPRAATAD
ncbi:phytoene/squalene synthase family protein, partial [Streptomyces poonensis]